MSHIKQWQDKIKKVNKQVDFQDFLLSIGSWFPLNLYKNDGFISRYPDTSRTPQIVGVTEEEEQGDYNMEYNHSQSFFNNFKELYLKVPRSNLIDYGGKENSDFADMVWNCKNAYISMAVINSCENVLYGISIKDSSVDIINGFSVWDSSISIYQSAGIIRGFKIFYSRNIRNSSDIWFCSNLSGCKECLFCDDLTNVSYFIKNKEYSEEEYFAKKEILLKETENFHQLYKEVNVIGNPISSDNVTGSAIINSFDIDKGYYCSNVNKGKNLITVGGVNGNEEMYNVFAGGSPTANNFYGVMGANGENLYSCVNIITSSNLYYSIFLESCSFCLGCIGLKNKSYCILNKQYTKQEWEILADKIFASMEQEGTLGDFFPGELNPFYFNDTMAGLLGNFTKQEVEKQGYMWRDEEIKVDIPEDAEVIKTSDLQDFQGFDVEGNWRINPEILKK